jgi:hypothetical protein
MVYDEQWVLRKVRSKLWAGILPVDDGSDAWIGVDVCDHDILGVKISGREGTAMSVD